ncbi:MULTISPECIES: ATP-binding protein [Micromonospora]|uniref:ATP-binding protein n=1 Tax=Micromonospora sicca TaxID=2202420 RepID=A0A317CZ30_9ACTN|nr:MULTISPECIES: ATP-binding protein [unclassified Micromonospora]MBM0230209.1 ATP-binding protein [Micromonospora sp. ATA51]PWR06806.1 ATP-binding protein [Micromonospora sp. 4G51]
MGSGGTDDVGAGWNTARGADEVALLSEEITAARVTALRHAVAAAARSAGLVGHGLEDFVLAVHELVTNVVRHGGGSGEVRLWQHHDLLTCQVSDNGPGLGEMAVALPSPGEVGHRGLWLARQLTEGLMIDNSGQGTIASVTAQLRPRSTVHEGR